MASHKQASSGRGRIRYEADYQIYFGNGKQQHADHTCIFKRVRTDKGALKKAIVYLEQNRKVLKGQAVALVGLRKVQDIL